MADTQPKPPSNTAASTTWTPARVRRVAAEAGVDPRTVDRYLARERITSTALDRIERALELFGWAR